ncbi:hypothetical protein Vspart_01171 [Vibrio spartinae]|uniref:Uncharacterized protein n=2 Tax=Vibrio spartinae TaxID=1918945 RepID=A0ABX6QXG2_9VIBR|nr:hypothetical protein Vspart_01171 [Vibrio spartinae]
MWYGSEDDDGTILYMDEETTSGGVYANRMSLEGERIAQKTVHSWHITESKKHKTKRLSAYLTGNTGSLTGEALASTQMTTNKENGGKEVFCNAKKSRDGLEVTLVNVEVKEKSWITLNSSSLL